MCVCVCVCVCVRVCTRARVSVCVCARTYIHTNVFTNIQRDTHETHRALKIRNIQIGRCHFFLSFFPLFLGSFVFVVVFVARYNATRIC